jgi:hypothetical protein
MWLDDQIFVRRSSLAFTIIYDDQLAVIIVRIQAKLLFTIIFETAAQ